MAVGGNNELQTAADLWQVVYVSAASKLYDQEELLLLLEHCRTNNQAFGITGMLAYRDGAFIQTLEGKRADVERTMSRIERDPRHSRVRRLIDQSLAQREFGQWSMAYTHINGQLDNRDEQVLVGFFGQPVSADTITNEASEAKRLMMVFRVMNS